MNRLVIEPYEEEQGEPWYVGWARLHRAPSCAGRNAIYAPDAPRFMDGMGICGRCGERRLPTSGHQGQGGS